MLKHNDKHLQSVIGTIPNQEEPNKHGRGQWRPGEAPSNVHQAKVILWPYPWLSSLSRDGLPRLDPTVVFLVRLIARNARFWVPCTLWIKFVLNINNLSAISCQKLNLNCGLLNMKINSNTIINRLGSWKNQLLSEKEYIKLSFFFI